MTKEQLIEFIDNNYADGEQLVWQVVSMGDLDTRDYESWDAFMDHLESSSELADRIVRDVSEYYTDWLEEATEGDE